MIHQKRGKEAMDRDCEITPLLPLSINSNHATNKKQSNKTTNLTKNKLNF